ncbi:MAG TPA: helix-turn-helix domain-containing protein [Steroidobacteraceae bacterium]|nr:helix-turn-helix domain-containing protein [Steroidobacteraceae bacterium]
MTYIESFAAAGPDPCHSPADHVSPHPQSAFRGPVAWIALADIVVTEVDSDAQARLARASGSRMHPPRCFVHLQLEGEGIIRQDGREALLRAGDFTLCDGARHYEISCPAGSRMLVLGIPTTKLRRHVACPESLAAIPMRAGTGVSGLLSGFLRHYWLQCRHAVDGDSAEQIALAVLDVLGAAYAQVPRTHAERSPRGTAHRIRIINYIHAHLYDPDLSPARIAHACRITTRYLHYLFSDGEETVTRYVLARRLEASSQALLADSQRGRTVTAIAFDHGFNSATHFGRVFRAHFGMTPREYRARADSERRPVRREAAAAAAAAGC